MSRRIWWSVGLAVAVLLVAIQFVPGGAVNPPVTQDLPAPPEVKAILRQACYDCHSHETRWPWYGRVAPSSWLVARDVSAGRGLTCASARIPCCPPAPAGWR